METIRLADGAEAAAKSAAEALRAGGVILYPTDTIYGLGADAFSDDAVDAVYAMKGRNEKKPIHAIVSDLDMAETYGEIPPLVRLLESETPKGKVTFIVKKKPKVSGGICREGDTFGFRIPDHEFCQAMLREFRGPITATSANIAGEETRNDVTAVLAQLGTSAERVALAVDAESIAPELTVNPSTVVDFSGERPIILREGAVPAADIWAAIEQQY